MKKIVVVSSTLRVNGNSEVLAQKFADGALDKGHQVQFVSIREINLKFCLGCLYCQEHDHCVINDGMNGLYQKFEEADIVVFSTPIYYYSISGQLKTFLDRLNPLFTRKNKFKDVYLLASCADEEIEAIDGAIKAINGWISCFDNVKLKGVVKALNVTNINDINKTVYPQEAYNLGNGI